MEQYIKKSTLIAEIEKLIDEIYASRPFDSLSSEQQTALWYIKSIMSSINFIEVKEVDLEKEIDNYLLTYWNEEREKFLHPFLKKMCVHFFELGITASNKIQKGK